MAAIKNRGWGSIEIFGKLLYAHPQWLVGALIHIAWCPPQIDFSTSSSRCNYQVGGEVQGAFEALRTPMSDDGGESPEAGDDLVLTEIWWGRVEHLHKWE